VGQEVGKSAKGEVTIENFACKQIGAMAAVAI
jgi:hypothetical protein